MLDLRTLAERIDRDGFAFVEADAMRALLEAQGPLTDWEAFTRSWDDLALDTYMADQGRYRRRRHATFAVGEAGIERRPHAPHFQAVAYNRLHGGIDRWFEPVRPEIGSGPSLTTVLGFCHALFGLRSKEVSAWHVEVHQFRIEARQDAPGNPTPEGRHRDGVDHVAVLMVRRENIREGTTTIHLPDGRELGAFTLTHPFEAALVDDARVLHGVTAVEPLDPERPAYRDVLVVTFRAAERPKEQAT
jgi:hypothetical protein